MNGTQYVEAARVLGERLHQEANGNASRMIEIGFLKCLSRTPDEKEKQICMELYREQLLHFQQSPEEAKALMKQGQFPIHPKIPLAEAAASTLLAQALLNHDACVVKR